MSSELHEGEAADLAIPHGDTTNSLLGAFQGEHGGGQRLVMRVRPSMWTSVAHSLNYGTPKDRLSSSSELMHFMDRRHLAVRTQPYDRSLTFESLENRRVLAPTNVTTLSMDEHWTPFGSPYILQNAVTVQNGATLRIDPNVEVRGSRFQELTVLSGGTLIVNEALFKAPISSCGLERPRSSKGPPSSDGCTQDL